MKHKQGEVIHLSGEIEFGEFWVRGHVDGEQAARAVEQYEGIAFSSPPTITPMYARWAQTGATRAGEYSNEFWPYQERGRGRFTVTRVQMVSPSR